MIDTVVLAVGDLQVNCYIVAIHGGNECVVIDPGADAKRIKKTMDELGLKCAAILLTHGHFDHIGAARELGDDNVKVYVHNADVYKLSHCSPTIFAGMAPFSSVSADVVLNGGETLNLAGMKIEVVHTPGHSAGSVSYIISDNIYCGDLIFKGSYGRYDFEDGDFALLKSSIDNILSRKGNYTIYPGHYASTTTLYERGGNPIYLYGNN